MSTSSTNESGQRWARAGFAFGAAGSLAGNVLAAWLPYGEAPGKIPGHAPFAQQAGSLVWPICLIVAVEVMSRIDWPDGVPWKIARFGGLGALAAGCAVISYGHIQHVLTAWNYGRFGSTAGAVVLDALMVLCGFAMLAAKKAADKPASSGSSLPAPHEPGASSAPPEGAPLNAGRGNTAPLRSAAPAGPDSGREVPAGLPPARTQDRTDTRGRTAVSAATLNGVPARLAVVADSVPGQRPDTPSGHRADTKTPAVPDTQDSGTQTGQTDSARVPSGGAPGQDTAIAAALLSGLSVRTVAKEFPDITKSKVEKVRSELVAAGKLTGKGQR